MPKTASDIIDFSYLESFLDTKEDLQNAAEIFFRLTDASLQKLETAAHAQDHKSWFEAAHQIKGSAGMTGATALATLCGQAQSMPQSTPDQYLARLEVIKTAYMAVRNALNDKIAALP